MVFAHRGPRVRSRLPSPVSASPSAGRKPKSRLFAADVGARLSMMFAGKIYASSSYSDRKSARYDRRAKRKLYGPTTESSHAALRTTGSGQTHTRTAPRLGRVQSRPIDRAPLHKAEAHPVP